MKSILFGLIFLFLCSLSALGTLDDVVKQWAFARYYTPGEVIHCRTYQDDFPLSPQLVHCNFLDRNGREESVIFQMGENGWERAPDMVADIFDEENSTLIDCCDFAFEDEMVE